MLSQLLNGLGDFLSVFLAVVDQLMRYIIMVN